MPCASVPALKTRQFLTSNKRQIVLKILLSISLYRIKNGQDYSIRFILSLSIMLIFETDRPFQTKVAAGKRLMPLSPPPSANQLRQWRFVWHIYLSSEGGTGEDRRINPPLNLGKTLIIFGKNWFCRSSPRLKIFFDPPLDKIRSALTDNDDWHNTII